MCRESHHHPLVCHLWTSSSASYWRQGEQFGTWAYVHILLSYWLYSMRFFLSLFRLSSQPTDQEGLANQVRSYLWKKTLVSLLYGFSVTASIYPLDPYIHRGFSLNPLRIRGFCPVLVVEQRFGDFGREKKSCWVITSKTVLLFLVQYCY